MTNDSITPARTLTAALFRTAVETGKCRSEVTESALDQIFICEYILTDHLVRSRAGRVADFAGTIPIDNDTSISHMLTHINDHMSKERGLIDSSMSEWSLYQQFSFNFDLETYKEAPGVMDQMIECGAASQSLMMSWDHEPHRHTSRCHLAEAVEMFMQATFNLPYTKEKIIKIAKGDWKYTTGINNRFVMILEFIAHQVEISVNRVSTKMLMIWYTKAMFEWVVSLVKMDKDIRACSPRDLLHFMIAGGAVSTILDHLEVDYKTSHVFQYFDNSIREIAKMFEKEI